MSIFFVLGLALSPTPASQGYVSGYAEGVFEGVYHTRMQNDWWRNEPPSNWYEMTSVLWADRDCARVGEMVALTLPDGKTVLALVADCMGDGETAEWMERNNIIGEVDYQTWTEWTEAYGTPLYLTVHRR